MYNVRCMTTDDVFKKGQLMLADPVPLHIAKAYLEDARALMIRHNINRKFEVCVDTRKYLASR